MSSEGPVQSTEAASTDPSSLQDDVPASPPSPPPLGIIPTQPPKPFQPSWYQAARIFALETVDAIATAYPTPPAPHEIPIRIVCVSVTHNTQPEVAEGDILIHAGDLSEYGKRDEIQAQLDWLASLPHAHKIVIGGNHDLELDPELPRRRYEIDPGLPPRGPEHFELHDLHYLNNDSVTVTVKGRDIHIFGAPNVPYCGPFSFQYQRTDDFWAGRVPDNTDVLVTHGPPRGYLDGGPGGGHHGCTSLVKEVRRVRPLAHIFGHIHSGRGKATMVHSGAGNAADQARTGNVPGLFDTARIMLNTVMERVNEGYGVTQMVNPACVHGRGQLHDPACLLLDV